MVLAKLNTQGRGEQRDNGDDAEGGVEGRWGVGCASWEAQIQQSEATVGGVICRRRVASSAAALVGRLFVGGGVNCSGKHLPNL